MSCPDPERIAAAVAGEDRDAAEHALVCPGCRARLDEQRALRKLVGSLSRPPLTGSQRERLAAGLMARLDASPRRRSLGRIARVAGLAAAAIALALWALGSLLRDGAPDRDAPVAASTRIATTAVPPAPAPAPVPALPQPPPPPPPPPSAPEASASQPAKPPRAPEAAVARLSSAGARFGRTTRSGRDVIVLRDGELTVDARETLPAEIQLGETAIHVANAKVTVTARTGVIATVAVFAGSVEMSSGARSTVVAAGTVWEAPVELPRSDPDIALAAFREGWTALRQNQFAAAIAAFDRASDPVVHEDTVYWAAIATNRANDHNAARRRFTDFLTADGEKEWRKREEEFATRMVSKPECLAKWEAGWKVLLDSLAPLSDADLERTVHIRKVPLTVRDALLRSLAHVAMHVGQIVYVGKLLQGPDWKYLSIPPGQSDAYNKNPAYEKPSQLADAIKEKLSNGR